MESSFYNHGTVSSGAAVMGVTTVGAGSAPPQPRRSHQDHGVTSHEFCVIAVGYGSMEVVRQGGGRGDGERLYAASLQMHNLVLILNHAGNQNEAFVEHCHSILVVEVW